MKVGKPLNRIMSYYCIITIYILYRLKPCEPSINLQAYRPGSAIATTTSIFIYGAQKNFLEL